MIENDKQTRMGANKMNYITPPRTEKSKENRLAGCFTGVGIPYGNIQPSGIL